MNALRFSWLLMVAIVALFCSGCKTTENTSQVRSVTVIPAPWHTVKIRAWPNTNTIHWYDKINPVWWVGNNEEPDPPAWYEPGNPCRRIYWRLRNPFTNFSYYVIGVADRDARRSGWYPKNVSNPNRGWNFAVTGVVILNSMPDGENVAISVSKLHTPAFLGTRPPNV